VDRRTGCEVAGYSILERVDGESFLGLLPYDEELSKEQIDKLVAYIRESARKY